MTAEIVADQHADSNRRQRMPGHRARGWIAAREHADAGRVSRAFVASPPAPTAARRGRQSRRRHNSRVRNVRAACSAIGRARPACSSAIRSARSTDDKPSGARVNLTVRSSIDDGRTWPVARFCTKGHPPIPASPACPTARFSASTKAARREPVNRSGSRASIWNG